MIDKQELQLAFKDDHSALIAPQARASLAARGRADAVILTVQFQKRAATLRELWRLAEQGDAEAQRALGDFLDSEANEAMRLGGESGNIESKIRRIRSLVSQGSRAR